MFDLFWEKMFTHAFYMVMDEHIAKDIVQDIWLDIWNRRETIKIQDFEAYIYKAVRNNCYKHFRSNKMNHIQLEAVKPLSLSSDSSTEKLHNLEEMEVLIDRTLEQLPKRCKQIFKLSRYNLLANEQIAKELGISKRSVENQLSLALKAIRSNISISDNYFMATILSNLFLN